jgi:alkanesulfonate monooxygenase SsuD/methylene tetrahydromethanopterin reductase-like flavin-dependent oxidoreductase (luciferase family)
MDVGSVGIWTAQLDLQPAARAREVAAELDELGYGALWVPEAVGREAMTHAAVLLDATERLVVAALLSSAERAGELAEVEDELFRFGQVVAGNTALAA